MSIGNVTVWEAMSIGNVTVWEAMSIDNVTVLGRVSRMYERQAWRDILHGLLYYLQVFKFPSDNYRFGIEITI